MPRTTTVPFHIPVSAYRRQLLLLVRQALDEDIGPGDLTVEAMNLGRQSGEVILVAKSPGVLAGADAFEATFRHLDRNCRFEWYVEEGAGFRSGKTVARIQGRASALLTGERTAINFVAHLSGIATATRHLADLIPKGRTRLLDTRKTTPGWRYLEKRATVIGGAVNHRLGLHDALMVKDNHIGAVGDFGETVWRALKAARGRQLICEIHDLSHVQDALMIGASWLLLDNFPVTRLRRAVTLVRQFERQLKCRLIAEASGNVTARNIAAIARCGPDYISSGSITHSAPTVDFSMKWVSR
jgi:nicotinate-nucleotide pyrophosphorylase (carboxylating)